jgi:hypothetical protein
MHFELFEQSFNLGVPELDDLLLTLIDEAA